MAPSTQTSRVLEFKPKGKPAEEKTVSVGDGLRYIGATERAICPHFRTKVTFHRGGIERGTGPELALVGAPPQGSLDADLRKAGIGACVTLDMVEAVSTSGQWELVPAASMAPVLDAVDAAREARVAGTDEPAPEGDEPE